ncbi:ABC transporter permease [Thermoclostridium stercorarium subsp. leptospartum DSM 9219]|uniref:ABC transporter permease n=1 Tax=Thermoclostridium stercorarium subsp. leptospartum DSM 9219 TaxID=1346611 RepID=A0A1B1YIA0_THEST|nr:carbohydrate ABC transporter permease [Thermoclostridium stercorarium]ANX00495.1 ABC transporter permease [Thermoclostridium stercorarium subsp. leptospartum DSM 9219]
MLKRTTGEKIFAIFNYIILSFTAFACLVPMINVLAVSFSSSTAAATGSVKLWPVDFTLASYKYALSKREFLQSFLVSLKRVTLGYIVNMVMTISVAYPLSKDRSDFRARNAYAWFFIITMMFSGGLIPTFVTVRKLGLLDTVWALVLPGAVPVFNVILLMNFFRELPKEIEEAAYIDGASHWTTLFRIYLPLSLPSLATISLFVLVGHWNGWFDGMIYMNRPQNWPLQTYLRTILINPDISQYQTSSEELANLKEVSERTFKSAQVFLGAAPILAVYPFLQKYFMKGLVMGSVKG